MIIDFILVIWLVFTIKLGIKQNKTYIYYVLLGLLIVLVTMAGVSLGCLMDFEDLGTCQTFGLKLEINQKDLLNSSFLIFLVTAFAIFIYLNLDLLLTYLRNKKLKK
jgi:hypothetical protein